LIVKNVDYYRDLPYTVIVERHDDQGIYWVARIAELPHCLTHGNTPEEAVATIEEVKLDWIKSNLEDGLPVPEPTSPSYSGEIRVRMPPSLHQVLAQRATNEGVSLNQYMVAGLARVVGLEDRTSVVEQPKANIVSAKKELPVGTVRDVKAKYSSSAASKRRILKK
jgi:antitoxin HicB